MSASRLLRCADDLRAGVALGPEDVALVAAVLVGIVSGEPVLPRRLPGQRSIATETALTERDALLREAAGRFFPALPVAEKARALALAWARFEASAWIRERALEACPPRHAGTVQEFLWHIMKLWPRTLGDRRIRSILAASS